jgi:hypothetical protein
MILTGQFLANGNLKENSKKLKKLILLKMNHFEFSQTKLSVEEKCTLLQYTDSHFKEIQHM